MVIIPKYSEKILQNMCKFTINYAFAGHCRHDDVSYTGRTPQIAQCRIAGRSPQ